MEQAVSVTTYETWLITSTTYGTWLPGDKRGFVGPLRDSQGSQQIHNEFGTKCDRDIPRLRAWAETQLKNPPIYLNAEQATAVLAQFRETCDYRRWKLVVTAVMPDHFHALVTIPEEVDSTKILNDLKSYASRRLNKLWKKSESGTWWTESGSRRRKSTEKAIVNAVRYVFNQNGWLARWTHPDVPKEWLIPRKKR